MSKTQVLAGVGLLFVMALFLPQTASVYAKSNILPTNFSPSGLSLNSPLELMNNQASGTTLLASIELSSIPRLFITNQPKSTALTDLVVSPIEATASAAKPEPPAPPVPKKPKVEPTPTVTPSPSDSPSTTPSTTPTPSPSATPSSTPVIGGLSADILFSMVQNVRQSLHLPAFETDTRACEVAQERAPQVNQEIATNNMHAGLKALNLPYWNSENIISMRSNQEAFNWWMNDTIHREAIEGPYKYSCMACSGDSCAEEFTDFQSK